MYQVTSAAMSQVHYAEIELGAHITGALQALASATRSGLILAFTALAVTAITVAGSFRDGKYLNGLVAISAAYWLIVLALGFGNSAASLANPD
jgi:hypothetical protein